MLSAKENVRVVVRARPVNNQIDAAYNENCAFRFDMEKNTVSRTGEKVQGQNELKHTFDAVFEDSAIFATNNTNNKRALSMAEKQTIFFEQHVRPLIDRALAQGINLSILSYGNTGSGKTHTIDGKNHQLLSQQQQQQQQNDDNNDFDEFEGSTINNNPNGGEAVEGIVSLAMNRCVSILEPKSKQERDQAEQGQEDQSSNNIKNNNNNNNIHENSSNNNKGIVWMRLAVRMLEIYNDKLVDLLAAAVAPKRSEESDKLLRLRLRRREDGEDVFYVENLLCFECDSVADAMSWYRRGAQQKTFRSHRINAHSSRSHCIFTMIVTICSRAEDGVSLNRRTFEMNFVDLAGSERPDKIAVDESKVDMRQKVKAQQHQAQLYSESLHINGSLSTLGRVIAALAKGSPHVPFRESKLTSLLRHALGSNGLLLFIACVAANNIPETTRTLQFASQARTIRVVASPVLDANTALIAQLRARIRELEGDLTAALAMNLNNRGNDSSNNNNNNQQRQESSMMLLNSTTSNEFVMQRRQSDGKNVNVNDNDDDQYGRDDDDDDELEIKQNKTSKATTQHQNNNNNNNNSIASESNTPNNRESVLTQSLYVACTKMQELLKSNSNLRSQIDSLHNDQGNVSERLSELERENLNLREKLDILSSVVSVEAKTTESLLRAAVHGNSNFHHQYSSQTIYGKFSTNSSSSVVTPRTKSSPSATKKKNNNNNGMKNSSSSPSSFVISASHPSLIPLAPVNNAVRNNNHNNQQLPPLSNNNNNYYPSSSSNTATSGRRSTGTSTPVMSNSNNNNAPAAAVGLPLSLFGGAK